MTCENYKDRLVDFVFGETEHEVASEIEKHISACGSCAQEVREIRRIIETLREADGLANRVGPDPQFKNRILRKIPQRRRESVVLMRRRKKSRAPLFAALSAAALFLIAVIYILAAQSRNVETESDSGKWARVPDKSLSGKPHLVDSKPQRPGLELTQSQDTHSLPSREADRTGSETDGIDETEEPVGPVPAPSPELLAEEPQDFLPIPIPEEPSLDTEPETVVKPSKEWIAQLYSVRGNVLLQRKGSEDWVKGSESDKLYEGDRIKTPSQGSGIVTLSTGGSLVLNRSTILSFDSHTAYCLEKGEALTCSYRHPLSVKSGDSVAKIRRSEAYVQHRNNHEARFITTAGVIEINVGKETVRLSAGKGILVGQKGKVKELEDIDIGKEIDWVALASKEFKIWIEGECCRYFGYFAVQEDSRDISNSTSLHKFQEHARLGWGLKMPHSMPCYIWVRYARVDREPEEIGLIVNCEEIETKTITAANAKYFWIKAFKTTLGHVNDIKLTFSSKKQVRSRVDLILVTNDPEFKPSREVPKGGYYGKD